MRIARQFGRAAARLASRRRRVVVPIGRAQRSGGASQPLEGRHEIRQSSRSSVLPRRFEPSLDSHRPTIMPYVVSADNRCMHPQPLAYMDPEFLDSEDGRPLRILAEYLEPLRRFKAQGIQDTVVFFGSARIHSRESAQSELEQLERRLGLTASVDDLDVARHRKAVEWSRSYEEARTLARVFTEWTQTLQTPLHRFVVTSGGGPGIMEAANRGANEAGGKTIGLNIRLPFEQGANPYITDGLHFEFHYFFMRKFWFAYMAKALVIFPGGFGTLDEMFEILTLVQTEKLERRIQIILYGTDYWDPILNLEPMADWGAIGPGDSELVRRANTPEEAFQLLQGHLMEHHLQPSAPEDLKAPALAKTRSS
jgi:uncharacterized protein (TIGR00730 family)